MTIKKTADVRPIGVLAVAKAAGVSAGTVSRAFNTPAIVREEVRERIFKVAKDLNYTPSAAARALRSSRTHIVGAAIPTLDYAIFAGMINEFQAYLSAHGSTTIVATTGFDNRNIYDSVRLLIDRGAEALLLVGQVEDERLRQFLMSTSIPVVTTYSSSLDPVFPSVGFDNYKATQNAMEYLITLGHKEFAMIAAETHGNDRQQARISAYKDCLTKAGAGGEHRIFNNKFQMRGGVELMGEILDRHPEVTAVVCNTDVFAIGALSECRNRGVSVPGDISIIGCDDFEFAELLAPPLTTIAVPAKRMGRLAAEQLSSAVLDKVKPSGALIQTELVIRDSTARARKD